MADLNIGYGLLIHEKDVKLHRQYFKEMCKLNGIMVGYKAPRADKHYTDYGEIESNYQSTEVVGCIFEEHPDQQTLKKLGWAAELQEDASIISVPYDLHDLQQGALFLIPSAFDNTKGRVFRVSKLSTIMIYPASITCQIVPEYEDTMLRSNELDYKHNSFALLNVEEEE